MDEVVEEFLVESYENLDRIDADLLALEEEPGRGDLLASVFRSVHTIKGTCGFLGFSKLERVTHVGESLLSRLRDGELELSEELTSALLRMVDSVRLMLASVEAHGTDGDGDWADLLAQLERLQQASVPGPPQDVVGGDGAEETVGPERRLGDILVSRGSVPAEAVELAGLAQKLGDGRLLGELLVDAGTVTRDEVDEALQIQREQRSSVAESSIRVDIGLLDDLMNLVSELVLARNQILQLDAGRDTVASGTFQRLNLITTELQEAVMKTRMQPIGTVWTKFPRLVRDLALACGKHVRIEMDGEHTELDKSIVEAIRDPLTHIIRNAVDHGVEPPDTRRSTGKAEEGLLRLRAFHESGQVNIEISDDGAGIDTERVRVKAVERGLVGEAQSRQLSERELLNLIFSPGFSTAEVVTKVSGRGVGMDVVRTNIEQIGGSVDVQAQRGLGTTVRVKIPLTLAIIPALIVTSGGQRYAIPQINLVELVRLQPDQAGTTVEDINGAPVYRLRGKLLPLVYLDAELGGTGEERTRQATSIVVLHVDDHTFGLVVDEVNDTEEIVVKALGAHVKSIPAFAGATIMGDGRVALILDVVGLARQAHVVAEPRAEHGGYDDSTMDGPNRDEQGFLLVGAADPRRRLAIPLAKVARLEEFRSDTVELAGGRPVIRYGDRILPLVDLTGLLGDAGPPLTRRDSLHVVVHGEGTASVGLVVDRLIDVVRQRIDVQDRAPSDNPALAGAAVIRDAVTDLVDMTQVVAAARLGGPGVQQEGRE